MTERMKKRSKEQGGEPSFEDSLAQLEKIVERLEGGDLPLEESLRLYEQGMKLSRACGDRLEAAERRIEILERARDGTLRELPFASESGEE
jgi:exodeoxyribonuclease VII small subunit